MVYLKQAAVAAAAQGSKGLMAAAASSEGERGGKDRRPGAQWVKEVVHKDMRKMSRECDW